MMRFVLLAILATSAIAQADSGTLPQGASLNWARTFIHEGNSKDPVLPAEIPQSLLTYFNMAHCECSQDTANDAMPTNPVSGDPYYEGEFNPELHLTPGMAAFSLPVDIYTGTLCDQDLNRDKNCIKVGSIADISSLALSGYLTTIPIKLYDLMQPQRDAITNVRPGCQPLTGNDPVWVLARTMGTSTYDYSLTTNFAVDTWAPCAPTDYTVTAAENAIQLKWTPSTTNVPDIAYYQALCATADDQPAFTTPPFQARYQTSYSLCGRSGSETVLFPVEIDPTSGKGTATIACEGMGSPTPTTDAGVSDDAALNFAGSGSDAAIDAPADAPDDAPDDAPPDAPDAGAGSSSVDDTVFGTLDKSFICGEAASSTANSMRIQGLKNGTAYKVALLTIDKSQNVRAVFFDTLVTPKAVTDFWEDLHDNGSKVEGGFCLLAETYGDNNPLTNMLRNFRDDNLGADSFLAHAYYATLGKLGVYVHGHIALRIVAGVLLFPLVLLALLWHLLTLPGIAILVVLAVLMRRRSLRLKLAKVVPAAAVLLVASRAHAQSPYWEDQTHLTNDDGDALPEELNPHWHVGIRVGPYTPAIDAQLGTKNADGKGPYAAMFGGYSILPMLDIDRVLWQRVGQLGVGVSLGYMGKSCHAFKEVNGMPTTETSPGDTTGFHLIPFAVSAVYRFTYLDDEYGIPLVPYARAGLAYYVWWITAPSGDIAQVCTNGGMPPCTENKGDGASLGFVGSIGLAIRAERIDASAARSMHESGIDHAGFYGELSIGKVDGFGSSKKLSVGDTTWFGGVEFEF